MYRHLRSAARKSVNRAPRVWNWRNRSLLPQRLRGGVHDADLRALALDADSTPLIFDVGANVGQTVMSLKHLAPHARILAFEPTAFALAPLIRMAERYPDVTVVPAACAATSGTVSTVFMPVASGVIFSQYASLVEPDRRTMVAQLQGIGFDWVDDANLRIPGQPIVTIALDDLELVPDIIKIDAEGFELEVLSGARGLLEHHAPVLFVETNQTGSDRIGQFLSEFGYEPTMVGQVNSIFAKPHGVA